MSDGLTAVYNFEYKIDSSNAGQPGGRLSNIGLSGAFGTLSFGQILSASDNHAGFVDNTQFYGSDKLTARVGSALSYAFSSDVMSLQTDLLLDDGADSDPNRDVEEFQFGMTVNIGDIGKVGLAYIDDKYSLDPGMDGLTGMKRALGQMGTVNSNPVPTLGEINFHLPSGSTIADLTVGENGVMTALNGALTATNLIGDTAQTPPAAVGDNPATNSYKIGNWVVEQTITAPTAATDDSATTEVNESLVSYRYTWYNANTGQKLDSMDDGDDDTVWNTRTTALAAQFSVSNVAINVGVAKTKANYDGHPLNADADAAADKESETTFFGLSGGLGDTGINYHFHWRDEASANPWVAGITKSLGGGASMQLEHANNDGASPNATNLGLRVDF